MISGTLAAVSAIIIAFYTNSISPASHGNFYELYAIAAAVVGGCSLRGGEGSVLGIVMGTALLQVLRNLVNLLDIPELARFRGDGRGDPDRRARGPVGRAPRGRATAATLIPSCRSR